MNKEFLPYEQALALKGIEFDEPCLAFYYDKTKFLKLGENPEWLINKHKASYIFGSNKHDVTFSQAFRWFRKKGYDVKVQKESDGLYFGFYWTGAAWIIVGNGSYEEAELECLKKLIEIAKEKKK